MGLNTPSEISGSFWWGIWLRKLERAKIAPPPNWLEDQVRAQKMFCDSRVAITSTGQRNQPNSAAVCVLLADKESAQCISAPVRGALFRGISHKQICKWPSLWIMCVVIKQRSKVPHTFAATRIMWVMNCLHHILYNACDSEAKIYYKNRWIFFTRLTNL